MSAAAPRSWGTLLAEYVSLAGTDRAEASRLARQWTEDERLTLLSADDRDAHDLWMMLLSLSSHPIGEGSRFKTLLEETAQLVSRPVEAIDLEGSDALAPPWSTGIDSLYGEIQFRGFSILGGETGVGKALAVDTPIVTPTGWTTIGEIEEGDIIFDARGLPVRVTAVSEIWHDRPCYRVTFSDGASLVADEQHEWFTEDRKDRISQLMRTDEYRERRRAQRAVRGRRTGPSSRASDPTFGSVKTTCEIAATLTIGKHRNHSIPVAKGLELPKIATMIDPYLLGVWLGDGRARDSGITTADPEMIWEIEKCGYRVRDYGYALLYWVYDLKARLTEEDLLQNKHIPDRYMRASREQRLALLQGLMDSDGHCDTKGTCEFSNTNERLAKSVWELALSLGYKATLREGVAKLNGRVIGPKYRVVFIPDDPVFRIPRKLARQRFTGRRGTHLRRYIVGCEQVESVPVRCIEIDREDGLFLAGREMIPTHNSKIATRSAFLAAANPRVCVVYLCAELDAPTTILYAKQSTGLDPRAIVSRFPNFHPLFIPAGCSFASIVASVVDSIPDDCDRVIVYVDTLNTVIEKCDAGERDGYFKLMRRFGIWMQESRIRSQGRIGWCAVSELNKEKQVLGIKLEKWADMVIRFQAGDGDGRVNVDVLKGRYAGKGQPGKYRLLHQTCELEAL